MSKQWLCAVLETKASWQLQLLGRRRPRLSLILASKDEELIRLVDKESPGANVWLSGDLWYWNLAGDYLFDLLSTGPWHYRAKQAAAWVDLLTKMRTRPELGPEAFLPEVERALAATPGGARHTTEGWPAPPSPRGPRRGRQGRQRDAA